MCHVKQVTSCSIKYYLAYIMLAKIMMLFSWFKYHSCSQLTVKKLKGKGDQEGHLGPLQSRGVELICYEGQISHKCHFVGKAKCGIKCNLRY